MLNRPLLAALAACALSACGSPPFAQAPAPGQVAPAPAAPSPAAGDCNAAGAQFAVGRPFSTQLEAEARQRSGAQAVRMLRPGQAVTMEFNSKRLNIDVDAVGNITRVRCG
jgi:hypothetical protein